jgi:hypothetical protein
MRFMHWAHDDLLECPADVVAKIIEQIEKDSSSGDNRR